MAGSQRKDVYFDGREVPPGLVDLYFERLGEPSRVLDLGCGRGSFGRSDIDADIVGFDLDRGVLNVAKSREQVALVDLENGVVPLQSASIDGFIAKDILEHLERPTPLVEELWRVLESGNRGVISVPMAKPRVVWGDYTHVRGFTSDAVETMVRDSGFKVVSLTPMGGVPGAGRLGFVRSLPRLLQLPGFRRFATSHEVVVEKPADGHD